MSPSSREAVSVDARLAALAEARTAGEGRVPETLLVDVDTLLTRAGERRSRSPRSVVVGLFGATGSGKSSLVNAILGADIARTHVRRPTTSEALAVVWQPEVASELLDWLEVRERVTRETPIDTRAEALVLLDLPDFDSVDAGHRAIAERLAAQVDALVWVVDPQKYADQVLHAQFIAPHAKHAAVTIIVLNQIDLLDAASTKAVVASLREIVDRDGMPRARIIPVSARTGEGISALRVALGDLAAAKLAADQRLAADALTLAGRMPGVASVRRPTARGTQAIADRIAAASGVELVASAVARSYRARAGRATGWPLVSWISRLRADPLTRLGLSPDRRGTDPAVHRTSLPLLGAGARAAVSLAVRGFADSAAEGLPPAWRAGVRERAEEALAALPAEVDLAIASTPLPSRGSWWWVILGALQWLVLAAGLAGVGWLLAASVPLLVSLGVRVPEVEGWPVPTLVILGAVLTGILLGLLAAGIAALSARARRRRARRDLTAAIRAVVDRVVVGPITAELDRARRYAEALAAARGR